MKLPIDNPTMTFQRRCRKIFLIAMVLLALSSVLYIGCKKSFLDHEAYGSLDSTTLANQAGIEKVLIGAYALLDGYAKDNSAMETGGVATGTSNWVFGGLFADDAHKGSIPTDQPDIALIETHAQLPTNSFMNSKWQITYEGITRANIVLKLLAQATDVSPADHARLRGEARFLRAFYHLEAKKIFGHIPYIDENMTSYSVPNSGILQDNTIDTWPMIEADAQFAFDSLPALQAAVGRANKWAAGALLGKIFVFDKKWDQAKAVLLQVYNNGTNPLGVKYALLPGFADNFNLDFKNSSESVFASQSSVNDNSAASNGDYGDALAFPEVIFPCCSFDAPSLDLVDAFKVDAVTGLPDPDNFNNMPTVPLDTSGQSSFTPYAGTLDPRLDWTVGRRGIPYLDYGLHPGAAWQLDPVTYGPFSPKKNVYRKSQQSTDSDHSFWTSPSMVSAMNINLIRFSDVILWLAECEVELGTNIDQARTYVNMIRQRAANPQGFVLKYVDDSDPTKGFTTTPAANYKIGLYTTPWADQVTARKLVHFERRLELGMEGHRLFDLVRWGEAGDVLNKYYNFEKQYRAYLSTVKFTTGKDEYQPLPQRQIDLSQGTLKQNVGY